MALQFSTGSITTVNCGAGTSLANLPTGTILMLVYLDNVNNAFGAFASKLDSGGTLGFQFHKRGNNGTLLRVYHHRATTDQYADSATGTLTTGWQWIAGTWNIASTVSRVYRGTLGSALKDVTGTTQAGSGAQNDDSAQILYFGGTAVAATDDMPGRIALAAVWNRVLSLSEMRQQQGNPVPTSGCCLFLWPGLTNLNLQLDRSGRGNHGTVTGATLVPGVALRGRVPVERYMVAPPPAVAGSAKHRRTLGPRVGSRQGA